MSVDAPLSSAQPPRPPLRRSRPPRGKVLVLSPHPDDETMGLGGTLAHHGRQGDPITALFVCSGIQGDPEGYFPRDEIVDIRRREAEDAALVLGITETRFLGYPDNISSQDISLFGALPEDPDEARRALAMGFASDLASQLDAADFTIVYYPWHGEMNADHWTIGQAVRHLMSVRPDLVETISFLGYDVWSACSPDLVMDISDVIETKLEAVRCYKSQLVYRDYEPIVLGIDAYRSLFLENGATYGEAFIGRYLGDGDEGERAEIP